LRARGAAPLSTDFQINISSREMGSLPAGAETPVFGGSVESRRSAGEIEPGPRQRIRPQNFLRKSGSCGPLSEMTTWITERISGMKKEKLDVVRGTGNVFRDLGHKNADAEQLKAMLAAEIIRAVDRERLTVRAAHTRTGIAAADFSRIRNADLGRFTVDRLMAILNRLGARIEIKVKVRRERAA